MTRGRSSTQRPRRSNARLSRELIVATAIAVADREGLAGLSMRRLATEFDANPMSIYHHVRDKDALLDLMLETVVGTIGDAPAVPSEQAPAGWTDRLRELVWSARRTMLTHPWAAEVLRQQDSPNTAVLAHLEKGLAIMRAGGCSVDLVHHALHALGSRLLGFSQDLFDDSPDVRADPAELAAQFATWSKAYPHVVELGRAATHRGGLGGCDDDAEFAFGLDLILEGLDRRRAAEG